MTLASIASRFQANSLGQPTESADPRPAPLPSATNEKDISRHREGRPHGPLWPRRVSFPLLTGSDASGVAGSSARWWGWAGRTFPPASLHSRPQATSLLPPLSFQPSEELEYLKFKHSSLICNVNVFMCNVFIYEQYISTNYFIAVWFLLKPLTDETKTIKEDKNIFTLKAWIKTCKCKDHNHVIYCIYRKYIEDLRMV